MSETTIEAPPEAAGIPGSIVAQLPPGAARPQSGPGAPTDQPTWIVDAKALPALLPRPARRPGDPLRPPARRLRRRLPRSRRRRGCRFEAVYHLYSVRRGARLRLKVPVPESRPVIPSVVPVWKAADWFEREAYDMFGLLFDGHPNLRRILTHEAFQGHPLRKDYDPARRWILTEDKIYTPEARGAAGRRATRCSSA